MIAGAVTIVALGIVWVIVAGNFPSQEELFSAAPSAEVRQVVRSLPSLSVPPTLDLTIPTSPPLPSEAVLAMIGRATLILKLQLSHGLILAGCRLGD
jgi:hypothetical protein